MPGGSWLGEDKSHWDEALEKGNMFYRILELFDLEGTLKLISFQTSALGRDSFR